MLPGLMMGELDAVLDLLLHREILVNHNAKVANAVDAREGLTIHT
jgi:hypothetical protein